MKTELTWKRIKDLIQPERGMIKRYNEETQTVIFTSRYQYHIKSINDYLSYHFPYDLPNISHGVNDKNGRYWLKLVCINKEVA